MDVYESFYTWYGICEFVLCKKWVHVYLCMHAYVRMCMYVCVDAHVYVYVLCLHVYVHAYIYPFLLEVIM